jgi:hypothetical protein
MKEKVEAALNDFAVTLEFSVQEVNALLNILNTPNQVPAITLVNFINMIQLQAGPQVEKAKSGLEAAFNADGVPKDLEEKN